MKVKIEVKLNKQEEFKVVPIVAPNCSCKIVVNKRKQEIFRVITDSCFKHNPELYHELVKAKLRRTPIDMGMLDGATS